MGNINSASGNTMRLAAFTGSVTIKDSGSNNIKPAANLLIHDGYTISTGKGAAAYICLNDKDVVKLGENGRLNIIKSGSALKAELSSGSLSSGLDSAELSSVTTSNMGSGMRG